MSYAPCKNPNCNSYGQPHPSCRCYDGMAEGGEAGPYCASSRAHEDGCEYFAGGGEAGGLEIDQASVVPDASAAPEIDQASVVPDAAPEHEIDQASVVPHAEKYGSLGQQVITGLEGAAQGVVGPLAPIVEKALGVPAEDIAARAEENPWTHGLSEAGAMVASTLAGVGAAGVAAKAGMGAAKALELGSVGSKIVAGAISNGILQASDEASKWVIGQGDPNEAVGAKLARIGLSGVIGGVFAGAGEGAKAGLKKIAATKIGERATSFLQGLGAAANAATPEERAALSAVDPEKMEMRKWLGLPGESVATKRGFAAGLKMYDKLSGTTLPATLGGFAGAAEGAREGWNKDGLSGAAWGAGAGAVTGTAAAFGAKALGWGAGKTYKKIIDPAVAWSLAHGGKWTAEAIDHALTLAAGSEAMTRGIDHAFGGSSKLSQQMLNVYGSPRERKKVMDWLEGGGTDGEIMDEQTEPAAPGYAEGGEVRAEKAAAKHDAMAELYPQQNMITQAAKARMYNYLNGMRPSAHHPKLAFDAQPDSRDKKRSLNRAIDIANAPLGVLKEVRNGTLLPEHVQHLAALHPEVTGLLQKKLTERITEAQMKGEKPSFKLRQGLSLLMGTPLSSEFTPAAIQAAQAVFAAKRDTQQAPQKSAPKKTQSLDKSSQAFLTDDQSRERRQQRA